MATQRLSTLPDRSLLDRLGLPKKPILVEQRKEQSTFTPWFDSSRTWKGDSCEDILHDELVAYLEYISPHSDEREARNLLVSYLTRLVRQRWREATVTVFGSSATGLELPDGDIDIVVDFGAGQALSDANKRRRLSTLHDIFHKSGVTKGHVNRIFSAKVPIIKFTTSNTLGEFGVDVSIRGADDSGPRAIAIIKKYIDELPALRFLVLVVKAFLSQRGLNDASQSSLSSYAITILCISFLQRNPSDRPQEFLDNPLDSKALGILLLDFFRHYSLDFPFATHYISVIDGGAFPKESKGWKVTDPPRLSVQCLLNPDKDITRGTSKIKAVWEEFEKAYDTLQTASLSPSVIKGNTSFIITESLLGNIIQVETEMEDHRLRLQAAVKSGAFQAAIFAPPHSTSYAGSSQQVVGQRGVDHFTGSGQALANRIGPATGPIRNRYNHHSLPARPSWDTSGRARQHNRHYDDRAHAHPYLGRGGPNPNIGINVSDNFGPIPAQAIQGFGRDDNHQLYHLVNYGQLRYGNR